MPASHLQTLRAMAYNNAWANHRLLSACAVLTPGRIRGAAHRLLSLDPGDAEPHPGHRPVLRRCTGRRHARPGRLGESLPCPELRRSASGTGQRSIARLIAWCDGAGREGPDRIIHVHRGTRVQTERADRLLLHLFQHQIHHRGQAHCMLSGTQIAPPQLDEFFSIAEAPLREAEFKELGWTRDRDLGRVVGAAATAGISPSGQEPARRRSRIPE